MTQAVVATLFAVFAAYLAGFAEARGYLGASMWLLLGVILLIAFVFWPVQDDPWAGG